ncbi:MAG: ribulose-phosphate 3-epimerase [Acidimicrobiales bacterium]
MSTTHSPRPLEISPSVLTADYARLGQVCIELEQGGADLIHWDVMDGNFVPNLSFGAEVIASIRPLLSIPFEAHLMVTEPTWILKAMVDAGCSTVMVHAEACLHLHRTLGRIRELGATPAVVINPATPLEDIIEVLDLVGLVLVMSVNPGFGGQSYLSSVETKMRRLRDIVVERELAIDIEIDGGIAPSTISAAASAGANRFVVGSAMFRDPEGFGHATNELRSLASAAQR